MSHPVLKDAVGKMAKSVQAFVQELSHIRTGRANPALLNRVQVDYYGSSTPLPQIASVSSPDARTLVVSPFDKSAGAAIEKAILESDLGFNPNNQGDSIFISVPALNDERRRELVKTVHQMAEESKVAVRNVRRDANDELKMMQKDGDLSEDDLRRGEADVQKLTDEVSQRIDERTRSKETDILAV